MRPDTIVAAIDAGGTSFKCALVDAAGRILNAWSVPTAGPDETLAACIDTFRSAMTHQATRPVALGIASFGPVDIDPTSPGYGTITGTAKPGWDGVPIGPAISAALDLPFHLETDVNAALAAEIEWGVARGLESAAYMTVGTGIGVGLFLNGGLVGRPTHPEFGHIRVQRHDADQTFEGTCALHGDCLEGLASATAMTARWGPPESLPEDHIGWEIEADYLAQACLNLVLATRLRRVIIGGGLMNAPHLLARIRQRFDALMGAYLPVSGAETIYAPKLGAHAGVLGGAVIALNAFS
ncbi:MAG: ROK family protein [Pseudomonadota bacterium]